MTLATATGPFLGMILMQYADFTATLIVCAIALSIGLVMTFPLNLDYITTTSVSKKRKEREFLGLVYRRKAFPAAFVTAFACFAYSSVISFLSSYTKAIGLIEAGSFSSTWPITVRNFMLRPLTGYYFDKKGGNFIIYPTLLVFAGALIYLAMIQQGYAVLVAGVLWDLGLVISLQVVKLLQSKHLRITEKRLRHQHTLFLPISDRIWTLYPRRLDSNRWLPRIVLLYVRIT